MAGIATATGHPGHGRPVVDYILDGVVDDASLRRRLLFLGCDDVGRPPKPGKPKHFRFECMLVGVDRPNDKFICSRDGKSLAARPVAFGPLLSAAPALYLANQANIEAYIGRAVPLAFLDICLQVRWGAGHQPQWHFDHANSAVHANMTLNGFRTVMFEDDRGGGRAPWTREMGPGMQYVSLRSHQWAGRHGVSYPQSTWDNAVITVQFRILAEDRDEIIALDTTLQQLSNAPTVERVRRERALLEGFQFPFVHSPRSPRLPRKKQHWRDEDARRLCGLYGPERVSDVQPLVRVPAPLVATLLEFLHLHTNDFTHIFNSAARGDGDEGSGDDEGEPKRSRMWLAYNGGSSLYELAEHEDARHDSLEELRSAQARYAGYHPRFRIAVDDLVRLIYQLVGSTYGPHCVEALLALPGCPAQEMHKDCAGRNLNVLVYLTEHEGTVMIRGGIKKSAPRKPGDLGVSWTDEWHMGPGNFTQKPRFGIFLSYGVHGTDGIIKYSQRDVDM